MSIRRYKFCLDPMADCFCDVEPDDDGEYVLYEDHEKLVAEIHSHLSNYGSLDEDVLEDIALAVEWEGELG